MGLTIALVDSGEGQFGDLRYQIADVTFDSSYPTGGEPLPVGTGATPSVGGIQNVLGAMVLGAADATSAAVVLQYKPSTGKILAMRTGALTPAGTIAGTAAGQVFSGSALAAHSHVLYVDTGATDSTGARVNAATNSFAMNNAAASIAGIATAATPGGIVNNTAGTPAGTNASSAITATFTGTAVAQAGLAEVTAATNLASVTQRIMFVGI